MSDSDSANISCVTAALQMLISIPEVMRMFSHRHYRRGHNGCTEISDEISRYINGESATVEDLIFILRAYSDDAAMGAVHFPSLEIIFFRVLHECVASELRFADDHAREVWGNFTEGPYNFLELRGEQGKDLADILESQSSVTLPEYLVIRIYHPTVGYSFPNQEIHLSNGEIYQLHCIVDKDSTTGRYRSSLVKNQCWRMIDDRSDQAASRAEVKTRRNYLYLYVRAEAYSCRVAGCPVEESFGSQASLDLHHQTDHPTCSWCHKSFLLRCLYREHLHSCKKAAQRRRFCSADSGNGSMAEVEDEEDPPVLPTTDHQDSPAELQKRKLSSDTESPTKMLKCATRSDQDTCSLFPEIKEDDKGGLWTSGEITVSDSQSGYESFNNSYLPDHQIVFFFKSVGDHFTIHSYSPNPNSSKKKYEICLQSEKFLPVVIKGVVGDKKRVLSSRVNSPVIYYDLIVKAGS